jgi:HEAT repeat protein
MTHLLLLTAALGADPDGGSTSAVMTSEPMVAGQTLTHWNRELRSDDAKRRVVALHTLRSHSIDVPSASGGRFPFSLEWRSAGSLAPALADLATNGIVAERPTAADLLAGFGRRSAAFAVRLLAHPDAEVRVKAVEMFYRTGHIRDAMPALFAALNDPDLRVRQGARYHLGSCGPDAVPWLRLAMMIPTYRPHVLSPLIRIGPEAKAALPQVRPLLADPDPKVRLSAAHAVWRLGGNVGEAVDTLVATGDAAGRVDRERATEILSWIGPDASDAVPALRRWMGEGRTGADLEAAAALGRIGGVDASSALTDALRDPRPRVRSAAVYGFRHAGTTGTEATQALCDALADPDADVRAAVVRALPGVDRSGRQLIPTLLAVAENADGKLRLAAIEALHNVANYECWTRQGLIKAAPDLAQPELTQEAIDLAMSWLNQRFRADPEKGVREAAGSAWASFRYAAASRTSLDSGR